MRKTTATKTINFGIDDYENVNLFSLREDSLYKLFYELPEQIDSTTFSNFCAVYYPYTLTHEIQTVLLEKCVANKSKIDIMAFARFCYTSNHIFRDNSKKILDLLNLNEELNEKLNEEQIKLCALAFEFFCSKCIELDKDITDKLMNKLLFRNESIKINTKSFTTFCSKYCFNYQYKKMEHLEANCVNALLDHLNSDVQIDIDTFSRLCYICQENALSADYASNLLKHLSKDAQIDTYAFLNFCRACQNEAINEIDTEKILKQKSSLFFSFSEIDQNEISSILNKFDKAARPLVAQKIVYKNKISLGFGIAGIVLGAALLGLGITAQFISCGIPNPVSIALMAGGGTMLAASVGTTIYNGVQFSRKKNVLSQLEEETFQEEDSLETFEEDYNSDKSSIIKKLPLAIKKSNELNNDTNNIEISESLKIIKNKKIK